MKRTGLFLVLPVVAIVGAGAIVEGATLRREAARPAVAAPTTAPPTTAPPTTAPPTTAVPTTLPPESHEHDHEMDSADGSMAPVHEQDQLASLEQRTAAATPAEREAAAELLGSTQTALERYGDEAAARASGFVPNPSATGGAMVHYRHDANRRDEVQLDPEHPEGLVYRLAPDGAYHLLGAVFTVRAGEPAPTPAGPIFQWHTHDETCGSFYVESGACGDTFRMLHIWTTAELPVVDPWIQPLRFALGGDA